MRSWNFHAFFHLFTYLSPQFFFPDTVTILIRHAIIIAHIYAPVLLIFHPFQKKNQAVLGSKHSKRSGRDAGLFTLWESSRCRPIRTRSVPSNILAWRQRRDGTETWRRRSLHCEHIRLHTHEKVLLNGDVPRRNGNVTYGVNQPLCEVQKRQPQSTLNPVRVATDFIARMTSAGSAYIKRGKGVVPTG